MESQFYGKEMISCSICLEDLRSKDIEEQKVLNPHEKSIDAIASQIFCTPCGHEFHKECLSTWLTYNQTCPNCRNNLSNIKVCEEEDYGKEVIKKILIGALGLGLGSVVVSWSLFK